MRNKDEDWAGLLGAGAAAITIIVLAAAIIYGYVLNVITVVATIDTMSTGEAVVRSLGMLLAPIGGIMGYF
jgi:hypothetical protein